MPVKVPLGKIESFSFLRENEWDTVVASVPNIIIDLKYSWWTRTAHGPDKVGCINRDGQIEVVSCNDKFTGARPILHIPHIVNTYNLSPGDIVIIGTTPCVVISAHFVLMNEMLCMQRFDPKTSVFKRSELFKWMNFPNTRYLL